MRRRKIRTRRPELGAALAATLCLAGCGSGTSERRAAPTPRLPSAVAAQLADQSDKVAAALDAGDPCDARAQAVLLQQETIKSINEGRVPGPFLEHLTSAVGDLLARIECTPPPDEDRGKGTGN